MKKKENEQEDPQEDTIAKWLKSYKGGAIDEEKLKGQLEKYFYSRRYLVDRSLVFDRDRKKISGVCEVVYGEGKSFEQLLNILKILEREKVKKILITRLSEEKWRQLASEFSSSDSKKHKATTHTTSDKISDATTDATSESTAKQNPSTTDHANTSSTSANFATTNSITLGQAKDKITLSYDSLASIATTGELANPQKKTTGKTDIVIVSAGTSDEKIARETQISLEFFNRKSVLISDVGVAGIGRLLGRLEEINRHKLIIAIAGMEASLPTLLSSLCPKPIIAVPTSVGHGANFGGIGALLSLLSSCSPGIGVVNIDSGFSAASLADKLLNALTQT